MDNPEHDDDAVDCGGGAGQEGGEGEQQPTHEVFGGKRAQPSVHALLSALWPGALVAAPTYVSIFSTLLNPLFTLLPISASVSRSAPRRGDAVSPSAAPDAVRDARPVHLLIDAARGCSRKTHTRARTRACIA